MVQNTNTKGMPKRFFAFVLSLVVFLSMLTLWATVPVFASGETMNRTEAVLFHGEDLYSTNRTYLAVESGNAVLEWASSDPGVAKVNRAGVVTATGVGTATITARTEAGSATSQITVAEMPAELSLVEAPAVSQNSTYGNSYPNNDSVHDPEIIYVPEEDAYYMLCTHNPTLRKSTDLVTWTNTVRLTDGYADTARAFVKEAGKYNNMTSFWAPHIVFNPVTEKYHVYYSVSNTLNDGGRGFGNKASAIGMTVLEPVEGEEYSLGTLDNWVDGGIVVKSYDAWRDGGLITSGSGAYRFGMDNEASANFGPNAIDPMVLFDKDGERMYMVYGSFFSGIFILELDPATGLPFDQDSLDPSDENYEVRYNTGVCIANRGGSYAFAEPVDGLRKGTQAGIEGPAMFYNEDTGYYYLFASYDYLDSTYNMRVARSKNITGPFYDYNGFDMVAYTEENVANGLNMDTVFSNEVINEDPNLRPNEALGDKDGMLVTDTLSYDPNIGTKIMGPYVFENGRSWRATGHNSVFQAADGSWLLGMHAKDPNQRLHVRSILWSEDGWPMASPARYNGENVDQPIDASYVSGEYELAIHNRLAPTNNYYARGVKVELTSDGTVLSSNTSYNGTWKMYEANKIEIKVGGVTYYGTVATGWDWENWDRAEVVFAALSDDGTMLWGKGGDPSTAEPFIYYDIKLTSEAHNVVASDYFAVNTAFDETRNSNVVVLNYSFDGSKFAYAGYEGVSGVGAVDQQWGEGWAKVTLMIPSYQASDLGNVTFHAKEDAVLSMTIEQINVAADFVLKDALEEKSIHDGVGRLQFTTLGDGETSEPGLPGDTNGDGVLDIIDLSNMIDWHGTKDNHPDWNTKYIFFDFNKNGEIDIHDISYVARRI